MFAVSLMVFGMVGCGDSLTAKMSPQDKIPVSEKEYGSLWPLTVTNGFVYKRDVSYGLSEVVFISDDGKEYGLNGTALSHGYRNIHEITKMRYLDDEKTYPIYSDVSGLIDIAVKGEN